MGKSLRSFFEHRPPVFRHQVLRQIGNHTVLGGGHFSPRRLAHTGQYFQQRGFTGSIFSHQGNTVFFVNLKVQVTKQGGPSEFHGQSIYTNHIM